MFIKIFKTSVINDKLNVIELNPKCFFIQPSMTDENVNAWSNMGISKDIQIERITDWANMLENRLKQLDYNYRAYPFGRKN